MESIVVVCKAARSHSSSSIPVQGWQALGLGCFGLRPFCTPQSNAGRSPGPLPGNACRRCRGHILLCNSEMPTLVACPAETRCTQGSSHNAKRWTALQLASTTLWLAALKEVLQQVADARMISERLQALGAATAQQLSTCTAQAGQAGAQFVTLGPSLVATAARLQQIAGRLLPAIETGEKAVKEVVGTLSELSRTAQVGQTQVPLEAFTTCHQSQCARIPCISAVQICSPPRMGSD